VLKRVTRELGRAELSPCTTIGRNATRRRTGGNPGAERRAPAFQRGTKPERYKVPGADSEEQTNPGRAFGSLNGSYYRWSAQSGCPVRWASGSWSLRLGEEVRPKRPTVGKEKPGITFSGTNDGRDSEPTSRVIELSEGASRESLIQISLKGSIVMCHKECRLSGCTCADRSNRVRLYTEEPYEWNSSNTGLWGERRVTGASTRINHFLPITLANRAD